MALTPAQKEEVQKAIVDAQQQHANASAALAMHHKRVENANKDITATSVTVADLDARIAALQAAVA